MIALAAAANSSLCCVVNAVEAMDLHAQLVKVHRADPTQHLRLQLLAASRHHLLGHLESLIVDERMRVNVCVQNFFVHTEQVYDRVRFRHKDEMLALYVQDPVGIEVVHVVLRVLCAPRQALVRARVVLEDR
jgi:hypothetical protein